MTAFKQGYLSNPEQAVPGEQLKDTASIIVAFDSNRFELGITYGTFVWYDPADDKIKQAYDAAYTLVGVLMRDLTGAGDLAIPPADNNVTNEYTRIANVLRAGFVLVKVKTGETPKPFGKVYIDATTGEATATDTDQPAGVIFVQEYAAGVWAVTK